MSESTDASPPPGPGWPWAEADRRLERARSYWICTTRPDGRPHAAPVWGVWFDGALYFGTATDSVKGRNLAHAPRVAVHLESADEVVILEGSAASVPVQAEVNALYAGKYSMPDGSPVRLDQGPPGVEATVIEVRPERAMAWAEADFLATRNRFRFRADGGVTALGWHPDEP